HQIVFGGTAGGDGAEGAGAGADVAEDHECCSAMFTPTLGDIGAHCVFADGVELMRAEDAAHFEEVFAARKPDFQPIGTLAHIWIAAPNTFSLASCVASASVGCAWIIWTRSSTVPSSAIVATASAIISVTVFPIM